MLSNNSKYNPSDLLPIILKLIGDKIGITTSSSHFNKDLVEFSLNAETEIKEIESDKGFIYVKFSQYFTLFDDECANYDYETIQKITDIENLIN